MIIFYSEYNRMRSNRDHHLPSGYLLPKAGVNQLQCMPLTPVNWRVDRKPMTIDINQDLASCQHATDP